MKTKFQMLTYCLISTLFASSVCADINWKGVTGNFFEHSNWNLNKSPIGQALQFPTDTGVPYTVTLEPGYEHSVVTNSWLTTAYVSQPITLDVGGYHWYLRAHLWQKILKANGSVTFTNGTMFVQQNFVTENNHPDSKIIFGNNFSATVNGSVDFKSGNLYLESGSFLQKTNGTMNIAQSVNAQGGTGTVVVAGGTLSATGINLGSSGGYGSLILKDGFLNPNGGTVSVGFGGSSSNGVLSIEGGTAKGALIVGQGGTGEATISGGTHDFVNIIVGNAKNGNGRLNITGGYSDFNNFVFGAGQFNGSIPSQGVVEMTGGTLVVPNNMDVNSGEGTFILKDGDVTVKSLRSGVNVDNTTANSKFTLQLDGGKFTTTGDYAFDWQKGSTNRIIVNGGDFYSTKNIVPGSNIKLDLQLKRGTLAFAHLESKTLISKALINEGAVLAPGGVGRPGRMTIYGDYTIASDDAVLDIDLGSNWGAGTIYDGMGRMDNIEVSGALTLGGSLRVRCVNDFVPASDHKFNIINHKGNLVAGTDFINVSEDDKLISEDGFARFDVLYNETNIQLANAIVNERTITDGVWDAESSWTLWTPGSENEYVAYFATRGSGTVTLNDSRKIAGLIFANAEPYTIAGEGSLDIATLDVRKGSHAVLANLEQTRDVAVRVKDENVLTLGKITGSSVISKTGSGTLKLTDTVFADTIDIVNGLVTVGAQVTLENEFTLGETGLFSFSTQGAELRVMNTTKEKMMSDVEEGRILVNGECSDLNTLRVFEDEEGYIVCQNRTQPCVMILR